MSDVDIDPDSLKVAELRDELKARGLDTKGNKAALVSRLKEALGFSFDATESGAGDGDEEAEEAEADETAGDESVIEATEYEQAYENQDAGGAQEVEDAPADDNAGEEYEKQDDAQSELVTVTAESEGREEEAYDQGANGLTVEDEEPAVVLGDEFRTIDEATQDENEEGNQRKRAHSKDRHRRSRSHDKKHGGKTSPPKKVEMEDCSWESSTNFTLDRYEADLNLRFNDRGIKAHPLTVSGFAYMWSGVRSNYGVTSGKVAYEVKVLEYLNVDHLPREELTPHSVRVGWSVNTTSLSLGEEPYSYGYSSTGQSATNNDFINYGRCFAAKDVVTAYLDFDSDPVVLSFAKNGEDVGQCFEIEREKLEGFALFPHIMTKNSEFECNFGAREAPYFPLKEGYKFLEEVPAEERVRGHLPPATKEECEVIMTVGLPGSGKSYWAENFSAAHPEKRYNILGTNSIINKMSVLGKPRRLNHNGEWSLLFDKASKCLNRLIELAPRKKRNYIIDQTNVFASSRRRKMQPFEGFQRKAVVILPTDEVYKIRVEGRTEEERKDIPESALNEMKASFSVPEEGECFESIEFVEEMSKEDRDQLVEQYRKEGREALPPPDKRPKREHDSGSEYRENRRGRGRGGYRGGYRGGFDPDRRGGYDPDRRGRGGYRGSRPYYDRGAAGGSYHSRYRDDRYRDDRYRDDRYYDDRSYEYKGSRSRGRRSRSNWGGGGSSSRGGGGGGGYRGRGYGWNNYQDYDDDWGGYSDNWGGYNDGWSSYR